ncbi:MAG: 2-polyprenyl-6-methoxyphenol hydroxylase-like FAD-dependent oxidoreductase [Alcanivorax sp.]|jgi:2-polyprenyl-6-methoxyphenol hydroxylase-like FAD-dependent oxidoreductase
MVTENETVSTDVLIIGGSISGAALAARLAPLGLNIILVERKDGPIDTARGDHLQPYTAELLAHWGLLDRFMAAGAGKRMGTLWKSADGELLLDGAVDTLDIPHPYYLYLNHEKISDVFLAAAAENTGFALMRPASFQSLEQGSDQTQAIIKDADGRTIRIKAGLIVGADGRSSRVRGAAGIECERYEYINPLAIVFAKPAGSDPRNNIVAYACDFGTVLAVPRTGGGWKLGIPVPKDALKAWHKAGPQEIIDWLGTRIPDLRFSNPSQATFYPVHRVSAQQWVKGNIVVIGDASHSMHPARGMGMNIALKCVDQLAKSIEAGATKPGEDSLRLSAEDYESRMMPQIHKFEEENHRQGVLMDEAGTMPLPAVHGFLKSIATDTERLHSFRNELAGYNQ